jgi:uracil-DNA glycosylase family 4
MSMIAGLLDRPSCKNCDLCVNRAHVGIGGRLIRAGWTGTHPVPAGSPTVLVVGQSPGANEDKAGKIFIGRSGKLLENGYLPELPEAVTVYATNAVKCLPAYNVPVKQKQVRACQEWLIDDVQEILKKSKGPVFLLCVGAVAVQAVLGIRKLHDAFGMQGKAISAIGKTDLLRPVQVFTTYHPAFLLRDPRPGRMSSVEDHLALLSTALSEGTVAGAKQMIELERVSLSEFDLALAKAAVVGPVCVDIETYGIRPWNTQTQFNPHLSKLIDGVPYRKQIESVAFAVAMNGKLMTTGALMNARTDGLILRILRSIKEFQHSFLGTNILFDLSYLCAHYPSWTPPHNLIDLCVLSFLDNPDRPEMSLKDLKALFLPDGVGFKYAGKGTTYADDDAMLEYNIGDVVNPLLLRPLFDGRIKKQGAPPDLSKTLAHYSKVLHVLLHMTIHGVAINGRKLDTLRNRYTWRVETLEELASKKWGMILAGKGSGKSVQAMFNKVAMKFPREGWEVSEKTKVVSTGVSNFNIIESLAASKKIPVDWWPQFRTMRLHRRARKLKTTYLCPLAAVSVDRGRNRVYPHWFPVPSQFTSNEGTYSTSGGTRQARVTCKRPALMTSPRLIKQLYCSRYPGDGWLYMFDYSQLELRVAAMMSGDDRMIDVYMKGRDLHQETLDAVMGRHVDPSEIGYDNLRRKAKFVNFGILYGMGANALQAILWKAASIRSSLAECQRFINGFKRAYPQLVTWQKSLLTWVSTTGRLTLPITGHWLSFPDPAKAKLDKAIFNFPVQATAANIMLTAQYDLIAWSQTSTALPIVFPLNIYDAILADTPRAHKDHPDLIASILAMMTGSAYIQALRDEYGCKMPFSVDYKVLDRPTVIRRK